MNRLWGARCSIGSIRERSVLCHRASVRNWPLINTPRRRIHVRWQSREAGDRLDEGECSNRGRHLRQPEPARQSGGRPIPGDRHDRPARRLSASRARQSFPRHRARGAPRRIWWGDFSLPARAVLFSLSPLRGGGENAERPEPNSSNNPTPTSTCRPGSGTASSGRSQGGASARTSARRRRRSRARPTASRAISPAYRD